MSLKNVSYSIIILRTLQPLPSKWNPVFAISTRPTIVPLFSPIQPPWSLVSLLSSDIPAKMLTLQRLSICYCLSLENSSPRHVHGLLPYFLQVSTQTTFSKRPSQTTSYKVALYSLLSPSSVWFFFPWCSSVPVVYSLPCFFVLFFSYTMQHVGS